MEQWYSNIEREALGILHMLVKLHHYCFVKDVYVITDHKPLAAMISKDVSILLQWLQGIMLHIHQYSVHIIYNPSPELYIADWLSPTMTWKTETRYECDYTQHQYTGRCPDMHPNRHMSSNRGRSIVTDATKKYNQLMAIYQTGSGT